VVAFVRGAGAARRVLALLLAPFAAAMAYCVWTGGDAWEWMNYANRFLASTSPPLLIATAFGAAVLSDRLVDEARTRAIRIAAAALACIGLVFAAELLPTRVALAESGPAANHARALTVLGAAVALIALLAILERSAPARRRSWFFAGLVVIAVVSAGASPWRMWLPNGGGEMRSDMRTARAGALLGEALPPGTSIAVTHAGNLVYLSGLPAVDVLGKSDPVISATAPRSVHPGHNKWAFEHSIATLRPDIILEYPTAFSEDELAELAELGYEHLVGNIHFDAARVDRSVLEAVIRRSGLDQPSVSG
jgi:hypothetical protein